MMPGMVLAKANAVIGKATFAACWMLWQEVGVFDFGGEPLQAGRRGACQIHENMVETFLTRISLSRTRFLVTIVQFSVYYTR